MQHPKTWQKVFICKYRFFGNLKITFHTKNVIQESPTCIWEFLDLKTEWVFTSETTLVSISQTWSLSALQWSSWSSAVCQFSIAEPILSSSGTWQALRWNSDLLLNSTRERKCLTNLSSIMACTSCRKHMSSIFN